METVVAFTIVFLLWIAFSFLRSGRRKDIKRLPPGPSLFEVIRKGPQLMRQPLVVLGDWAKEYGSMFVVSIGPKRIAFLNDIDLTKKCFNNSAFAGRMSMNLFVKMFGKYGLFTTDGAHWEEIRRFTLREIRDYGFGKPHIKSLIEQQALGLVASFRGHVGKPVCLENAFNVATLNSLWSIVTGRTDNDHLQDVTQRFISSILSLKDKWLSTAVPSSFPFLGKRSFWTAFNDSISEIDKAILTIINSYERIENVDGDSRNFLDSFFLQVEEKKNCPESLFYGKAQKNVISDVLKELLIASFGTSAIFMNWKVLQLVKHPAVQKRLQDEIDSVVGNARHVTISDRERMPYTQAFIVEAYRVLSFLPVSGFQKALADDYLEGYFIPKGTMFFVNVHYLSNEKTTWGDPEKFRPERFLEEDGPKKMRHVIGTTFMVGKRSCPGQTLAWDTGFLFLTNILQNFDIRSPTIESDPGHVDYQMTGIARYPKPIEIILSERCSV